VTKTSKTNAPKEAAAKKPVPKKAVPKKAAVTKKAAVPESLAAEPHPAREQLPIPDAKHVGLTTYDAKDPNTKYPPIKELRPPKDAPNVLIVLIDDVGFGAPGTFGGRQAERRSGQLNGSLVPGSRRNLWAPWIDGDMSGERRGRRER